MKIVVLDGYTLNPGDISWDSLMQMGDVTIYDRTPVEQVVERAKDAEAILTNKAKVTKEHIDKLPALKYIGILATGYNIIDIEAAKQRGIIVSNAPGYSTASVAQLVFAFLLEMALHVQKHSDSAKRGDWVKSADFSYWNSPLIELAGKTIGIIGFGEIGQRVADIASAFGMNVIAHSRTQRNQSHRANFAWVDLDELLTTADVVSIHCPLTQQTKGLINKESLKKMKSTALLVNTSRGPIIVDQDLADALNNGVIAGAGIDVLSVEPPPTDNPLLSAKNCLVTPHIAWATKEARLRLLEIVVSNLNAFIKGRPVNVVNK
ncbi:D-2-hydroxyacid dehydrogenase [Mucilaginibacter auburnensis]|uniref:Glycerate dehydrogenase n=1 Tax=Mucilaginibacter auburnensis TaxID=1457233 RepID=A0A2H9VV75_9SPHI|nr:D-2-hydroxyacid dehydrogenase [Mucilaginibacter auburnensis]PJJ84718.1 glycerate dehydrogenase [Mucilaginibacter auburnensis]